VANQAAVYWRLVLCDLDGRAIEVISQLASNKQLNYALNRPARVSFDVPSDHPIVNTLYTDARGFTDPQLTVGNRVIKAYRSVSGGSWDLRGVFLVWDIQDSGDGTTTRSAVTAYDIMQLLRKRLVYSATGTVNKTVEFNGATDSSGNLTGMKSDQIAKTMVDRSITYAGACGITTDTGLGASFEASARMNKRFDQAYVAEAIIEMCDTGVLDVWFQGLDRTDGTLWAMHASPMRRTNDADVNGFTCPDVVIAYAAAGRTAYEMDRTVSMETVANDVRLWALSTTGPLAHVNETGGHDVAGGSFTVDGTVTTALNNSISKYYRYEDATVISAIRNKTDIQALAVEEAVLRYLPRTLMTVLPTPGLAPPPFASGGGFNYFVGDTVHVVAGTDKGLEGSPSMTREATSGLQRVYGISLDVTDDGVERVAGLDVSPQTGV
jgi:hypothetical protein